MKKYFVFLMGLIMTVSLTAGCEVGKQAPTETTEEPAQAMEE